MEVDPARLRRTLGAAARVWAGAGHHETDAAWWIALSGQNSVSLNLACSQSPDSTVLVEHCLEPVLEQRKPAIIMLAGPGLATAQTLIDAGWVNVGATPLMLLAGAVTEGRRDSSVRALATGELPLAREIITDSFALDEAGAATVIPDSPSDLGATVWGLFEEGRLLSAVTIVREDDLSVVWSMATRGDSQRRGLGRRLLESVLTYEFEHGAEGSLLNSSREGEKLYRDLGYGVVDYLQLWSRPRWVLGSA
ncbi:MAG: GNAT family N-acetyltransferase [Acidimicrobiales bacterium]|jgi:GNAT superfamily N-acetyltransferase